MCQDISIGNGFTKRKLTAQEIKVRIEKWDYLKLKKNTIKDINIVKRKLQKKVFTGFLSDKILVIVISY